VLRGNSNASPPVFALRAHLATAAVDVQIADLDVGCELEADVHEPGVYRLDLSLGNRAIQSRLCYTDHWPKHRFEVPGQMFLLPPGETIRARSGTGREHLLLCRLREDSMRQWWSADRSWEWDRSRIEASLDVSSHSIKQLLLRLGQEARAPGFASEVLAEAIGVQIAVELERYYLRVANPSAPGTLAPWRLRLIEDRLHASDDPPTLSELASLCDLSVRHLARGFRESRGISIGKHIAQLRLDNAKRLLAAGMSVKAVAFAVGFKSVTSFCFAFRNAAGVPPRQYRGQAGDWH
jgi:AraC family transcriptional regulator